MNSEMQKRLYEMEVTPPTAVWEKLSSTIDEINEDNRIAQKVLNAELNPPFSVWEKIDASINVAQEKPLQKKGTVINLRRFALAAVLIGVIVTGWIVYRNIYQRQQGIATVPVEPAEATSKKSDTTKGSKQNGVVDAPVDISTLQASTAPVGSNTNESNSKRANSNGKSRRIRTTQSSPLQYASLNTPLAKSFDRSIDDLSLVTSDQHYLTMVNANGRLVKIPAQLASLAPHLQDKPVAEDFYEVMFGEGAYWKETLNEWRKKVASVPVASGDAFTSLIELLKSVQDK